MSNIQYNKVCPECGCDNACQNVSSLSPLKQDISSAKQTGHDCNTKAEFNCWCQQTPLSENARNELKKRALSEQCLCQACLKRLSDQFP